MLDAAGLGDRPPSPPSPPPPPPAPPAPPALPEGPLDWLGWLVTSGVTWLLAGLLVGALVFALGFAVEAAVTQRYSLEDGKRLVAEVVAQLQWLVGEGITRIGEGAAWLAWLVLAPFEFGFALLKEGGEGREKRPAPLRLATPSVMSLHPVRVDMQHGTS